MGQTEVTQDAYMKVMGYNPSVIEGPNYPADSITGLRRTYIAPRLAAGCRARPNGSTRLAAAPPRLATATSTTSPGTGATASFTSHPVAQKKPNAFGLYDMLGNVLEWTYTWYWVQHNQENINPTGPSTAEYKELRGGGWWDNPDLVRASYRIRLETTDLDYDIGFRCVGN